jgi:hypothetical protein
MATRLEPDRMSAVLPTQPTPRWLFSISAEHSLPMAELLNGSVFYPACGIDGRPVQYLGGFSHSFIYADYGYPSDKIESLLKADGAFFGYRLKSSRLLPPDELPIDHAWKDIDLNVHLDGNPNRYRDRQVAPYAFWSIFQRLPDFPENHGPELFSLLYLAADGVAAYHALYHSNRVKPSVVAIIQPGEGFGWNWTYFFDSRQVFCRTVMGNKSGKPDYLLLGTPRANREFRREVVWTGYGHLIKLWKSSGGYLGLWQTEDQSV